MQLNKQLEDCTCVVDNPFDLLTAFCWLEQKIIYKPPLHENRRAQILSDSNLWPEKRLKLNQATGDKNTGLGRPKAKERPNQQVING